MTAFFKKHLIQLVAVAFVALFAPASAWAIPVTFTKIVDTSVDAPGSTGTFTRFGETSIDGETVVFQGGDATGNEGIYTSTDGVLTTIADTTDDPPGSTGTFAPAGLLSPAGDASPPVLQANQRFVVGLGLNDEDRPPEMP